MLSTSKAKSSFILHLCVQCSYIYNNNIGTLKWNYTLTFYLPYRQFAFTFALVDFRCNHITCKPKISYFTCMIISYQYISCCQITMNYLRTREKKRNEQKITIAEMLRRIAMIEWKSHITIQYTQTCTGTQPSDELSSQKLGVILNVLFWFSFLCYPDKMLSHLRELLCWKFNFQKYYENNLHQ